MKIQKEFEVKINKCKLFTVELLASRGNDRLLQKLLNRFKSKK